MIRLTELLDESEAGDEAKAKGLDYLAFGRYGKNGRVTHIVDPKTHKLIPAPQGPQQSADPKKQPGVASYKPNSNPATGGSTTYKPGFGADAGYNASADRIAMGTHGKHPGMTDPKSTYVSKPAVKPAQPTQTNWVNRPLDREPGTEKWTAADFASDPRNGGPGDSHAQGDVGKDYTPPQGSTSSRPSVSRSPDGSRGSKQPLAQEPKGAYGNTDMPTSMPKSTAPQPVENPYSSNDSGNTPSFEDRLGDALKVRDRMMQQAPDDSNNMQAYDDRIRQLVANNPPQNPHLAQYLINRGLMQDPVDQEEPTPRDASGASHFGPDESVIEGRLNELKPKTYKSYQKKADQNADDSSYLKKRYHDAGTKSRAKGDTIQAKKFGKLSKFHAKNQKKREKGVDNAEDLKDRRTWTTNSGKTATRQADGSVKYTDN